MRLAIMFKPNVHTTYIQKFGYMRELNRIERLNA